LISLYSHTGTHIDAPTHFYANGCSLDKYPVEQYVGKALAVDCRSLQKGEKIPIQLLEEKGNVLDEAEFILFLTGQSALWGNPAYFGDFPVMSDEVVEWVNRRKIKGIGIDAPSFDPVSVDNHVLTAHELYNHLAILKTNHTLLLENLCNIEEIGNGLFTLCALPLPTVNADGAPARIIAMVG
jgi:kynurenine formamidase